MTEQKNEPENPNQPATGLSMESGVVAEAHSLGIAGRTARTFINTPVTPMLLVTALFVGLLGLIFTPRQEDPQISVPMIDLYVQYSGATAEQVESLVTSPLERLMDEIPGVRHVYSMTEREQSIVTVRFKVGEDLGASIVKVYDKIQSNLDRMPPGVSMPMVKPVAVDDVPAVTLTLWSKDVDDGALRILAKDVLQKLGEVPNTGKGFVVGGRSDQIRVEVLPERLAGYGISLEEVASTIQTANAELNTGAVETGGAAFTVYSGAFLRSSSDIERLVIGIRNGAPVYVRDVAKVTYGPEETSRMVTHFTGPSHPGGTPTADGEQAVTIALAKKEGTNGVAVAAEILQRVEQLKGNFIPANVFVEVTRDYGKSANDKVNELLGAMMEAAIIVSILCVIGLGARAAFVVITVIPVVILLTIWWTMMIGYTIDRVSLFALIFSIGILVDDATVVVENIFRHWLEKGRTTVADAIEAVREVGNPTILATFTIISALLPMGWVSGLMGPYMRPIPVLGASAMFFSLIAAFVFTPWFAMRVRPQLGALKKAEEREKKTNAIISRFYRPLIMPLVESRKKGIIFLVSIIALTAMLCSMFYTQHVRVKMLPFDNKPEFSVIINMPEGTALPVTANLGISLANAVRTIPEVVSVQSYSGTAQPFNFNGMVRHYYLRQRPWQGDLVVRLIDKTERDRGSHEIAEEARELLTPIAKRAGGRIAVVEMPPGPPVLQTVVTEIHGPDAETRREVARNMLKAFEQAPGVVDVDSYMIDDYDFWRFEVDREKAVRQGISVDSINNNLAMAMGGFKLGDVKRGKVLEPTYIVMQVPLASRSDVHRLSNLPIKTPAGQTIPLAELGRFVKQPHDQTIFHKDLRGIEYVVGEMAGRLGAPIYGMFDIEAFTDNYTTPDGVVMDGMPWTLLGPPNDDLKSGFEWTGEWTVTFETFRDMGIAFMAAMVLIYGLIVWEFKNFALAGLIMAPIPLTMIGIIPGHWLMDAEFTATSMIGMIALGGIIVRQSILIVEFVKIEVAKGTEVREAAVRGAEIRMRPIFITSLTLMAGAFAIINDPIFQGMAVSLLWGAGVGTIMAILVIPMGCISARRQFYLDVDTEGNKVLSPSYARIEGEYAEADGAVAVDEFKTPIWMRLWGLIFSAGTWLFYIARAVFLLLGQLWDTLMGLFGGGGTPPPPRPPAPPGSTGGPSSSGTSGGGTPPPPRQPPPSGTPPPPRQAPPSGTAPPPREAAPAGTPPPPRETPPEASKQSAEPPSVAATAVDDPAKATSDVSVGESEEPDGDDSGGASRSRRGIRLK